MKTLMFSCVILCTNVIVAIIAFKIAYKSKQETLEDWLVIPSLEFSAQTPADVAVSDPAAASRDPTVVTARGVWKSNTDLLAQLQTGEIVCRQDTRFCTEYGVGFMYNYGKYSFWPQNYTYSIDIWSSDQIVASDLTASPCLTTTLVVNHSLRSARKIIDVNPGNKDECGRESRHIEMELRGGEM